MLKVIIIDDEPLARENLSTLLADYAEIKIIGEAGNAIEGIRLINQLKPDAIFVDIQMPKVSGLEMLSMLDPDHLPLIVFATAYDEYAVKAFEEHAFDYLLKPIEELRLKKTITRLVQEHQNKTRHNIEPIAEQLTMIPCIGHSKIYLINVNDIVFVGSNLTGVQVVKSDGSQYVSELTLRVIEERTDLVRCHRQYLLNLSELKEIQFTEANHASAILNDEMTVPISRRYLKTLKERLGLN